LRWWGGSSMRKSIDVTFGITSLLLVIVGFIHFLSAALSFLSHKTHLMSSIIYTQAVLGLGLGTIGFLITSTVHYKNWRHVAYAVLALATLLTLCARIPGIGYEAGGAWRWILIAGVSLQPSELLKIATVIAAAHYFAGHLENVRDIKKGLGAFFVFLSVPAIAVLIQPDIGTFGVTAFGLLAVYIAAGARWQHVAAIAGVGAVLFLILLLIFPYARERVLGTYGGADKQGSAYHIDRATIAIGSGGLWGRGIGQSIQKYYSLPQPHGDSIFAIAAEELGFIGSSLIIILYALFAIRGYALASLAPDQFGSMLTFGLVTLIISQSFINIASITDLFPLTGVPLVFMSHGGTSLAIALCAIGIVCNISKHRVSGNRMHAEPTDIHIHSVSTKRV
jgi:cell division protein FtsW